MSNDTTAPDLVLLYRFAEPRKLKMGRVGDVPIFSDCARCSAREPEIAGFLGRNQSPSVLTKAGPGVWSAQYAFLCHRCCEEVEAEATRPRAPGGTDDFPTGDL